METVNHVIVGLFPALGTANVFAILIGLLPVFQWWRVIPENVIHKFMVRSYGRLVRDCCTSKKVMIRDELSALTAILNVGKGDDTLYIDIYAQGDRHPSELLSWIRNEINDINHDLNISAEEYIYIIKKKAALLSGNYSINGYLKDERTQAGFPDIKGEKLTISLMN